MEPKQLAGFGIIFMLIIASHRVIQMSYSEGPFRKIVRQEPGKDSWNAGNFISRALDNEFIRKSEE